MRKVLLEGNVIKRGEEFVKAGYNPPGIWVDALESWEVGGTVINNIYTPPPPHDFSEEDDAEINQILAQPGFLRALAIVLFKDMKSRNPTLTIVQFKALIKAEKR